MCGICGILHLDGQAANPPLLEMMNKTLTHRGPDGEGYHVQANLGLAMRRLSIIDVMGSEQPLYNENASLALVFNGEIFNYQSLRQHLSHKGHHFRTQGDGETIVHLYEDDGVGAFQQLRGQFAIALYDHARQRLILARDPVGQLPLYYYYDGQTFAFASEIKALLAHPGIPRQSALDDPHLLALYLGYGALPAPLTAFKHIHMLPAAHYLVLEAGQIHLQAYWQLPDFADADPHAKPEDYAESVHAQLQEAVQLRMIADVPLGAFLSGGLDSSLVVALMRRWSNSAIKTFSIGFEGEQSFDETRYAQQVAEHLHTEHTCFIVPPQTMELLPRLVQHYDQPFADTSAIPTYLVSQLTRQQVTVALTGDGGDELFAGYDRFYAAQLLQRFAIVPRPVWRGLEALLAGLPDGSAYASPVQRARRFVRGARLPLALAYFDWVRVFNAEQLRALLGVSDYAGDHFRDLFGGQAAQLTSILKANMQSYLHDDLLIKTDRCAMMASLEARIPFLDHKLIELVAKVPLNLKLRGKTSKYLLKHIASAYLPESIIHRPKHGFGAPVGTWLRRDASLVRELLQSHDSAVRRLLNPQALQQLIDEHLLGKRDHATRLWSLLTLEAWYRGVVYALPSAPAN